MHSQGLQDVVFGELYILEGFTKSNISKNKSILIQRNKRLSIGRSLTNSIIIDHPFISGRHCIIWSIQFDDDSIPLVYIKDTSLNGTFINGVQLMRNRARLLNHGDIISLRSGMVLKYSSIFEENEITLGEIIISENAIITDFQNWSIMKRVLGNGTFGHVLVAQNKVNSVICAVKVIKSVSLDIEAKMLMKLSHPNIIKVYDTHMLKGKLYIFEELFCGGDLFSYLTNGNSLRSIPEFESLVITFQILGALHYLHKHNVVHRDLKLDNILLETPEPFTRIVLADFGIAKYVCSTKRRMFTTVGTPEYCAPEVGFEFTKLPQHLKTDRHSLTKKGYDGKCDIWSLGIIVHIMLTGISPFYEDGTDISIIKSAKKGKLKLHLKQWSYISKPGIDFVQSSLNVDILERLNVEEAMDHKWLLNHELELKRAYKKILDNSSV